MCIKYSCVCCNTHVYVDYYDFIYCCCLTHCLILLLLLLLKSHTAPAALLFPPTPPKDAILLIVQCKALPAVARNTSVSSLDGRCWRATVC